MLDEEVITLRRAAAFTRVRAAAFSRLQAKAFSWMRTVQHPWEETREEGAQDVVGEAGVSDPASEEGGDVQAGWGTEEKITGEAAAPNPQMRRAAPFDLAGGGWIVGSLRSI
jgi:hypothetical protein